MSLREIFYTAENGVGRGVKTRLIEDGFDPSDELDELGSIQDVVDSEIGAGELAQSELVVNDLIRSDAARDALVNSPTGMDTVSASETAMDAVSVSETARDAVRDSDLAFDTVAGVNMAIGKFAAGEAGLDPTEFADMDAVAASETAMDAVAASETAMDAVVDSVTAITTLLSSPFVTDSMYSDEFATEIFWNSGDRDLPETFTVGGHNIVIELESNGRGGQRLFMSQDGGNSDVEETLSRPYGLSVVDELEVDITDTGGDSGRGNFDTHAIVKIDGDEAFDGGVSGGTVGLDISSYSGVVDVEFGIFNNSSDAGHEVTFDNVRFS